jgi:hypothetical protein
LLPGILAQKDPHKQDTTRVLFSLYANMQQGKCKYFGYGFLRNKYPTARNKYPKGITNILTDRRNYPKE